MPLVQHRDAAQDAQVGVEGLGGQALAVGDGNDDGEAGGAPVGGGHLADVLLDHAARGGVDGGGAHRLVQALAGDAAHARAAVDDDPLGAGVKADR